jgi:uncharacterized membrane protein
LLLVLAVAGGTISAYLTLFEAGAIANVWDPVFGDGSRQVLQSSVAAALPVPDALLGIVGYGLEVVLLAAARVAAPQMRARLLIVLGAITAAMALASLGLVFLQAFVVHAWCLLCLVSAAISCAIAAIAVPHAVEAVLARRVEGDPRALASRRSISH